MSIAIVVHSAILKGNGSLVLTLDTPFLHKSFIVIVVIAVLLPLTCLFKRCFGVTVLGLKKPLDLLKVGNSLSKFAS